MQNVPYVVQTENKKKINLIFSVIIDGQSQEQSA